jgi:hypothetical protein
MTGPESCTARFVERIYPVSLIFSGKRNEFRST